MNPDLNTLLLELACYGGVSLNTMKTTNAGMTKLVWWCQLNLFLPGKGLAASVKSDFTHETPLEAVMKCYERLMEMAKAAARVLPTLEVKL